MTLRIALAAALFAASTGLAAAQTPPPPPPPGAEAPPPPPGEMERRRDDEGRPGDRGPRGGRGHGGPHGKGPDRDGASFNLRMGEARLMVRCGEEALGPCIEASRPLIDLVGGGAGAAGLPRPPSESLTLPPTPPAPGDMPSPIPGTDAPPVAPAN